MNWRNAFGAGNNYSAYMHATVKLILGNIIEPVKIQISVCYHSSWCFSRYRKQPQRTRSSISFAVWGGGLIITKARYGILGPTFSLSFRLWSTLLWTVWSPAANFRILLWNDIFATVRCFISPHWQNDTTMFLLRSGEKTWSKPIQAVSRCWTNVQLPTNAYPG